MSQAALFAAPLGTLAPSLRWYQDEAVEAIMASLRTHDSTLLVMATGTGKTQVFSSVAERFLPIGRVLCLAHRKELVTQAAERLTLVTGEYSDIEQAENWASNRARVVCASLQTITQPGRLARWPRDHFALIIADEAHHYVAPTYKRVLDHFTGKKLGVTATADRSDELAMGRAFSDVAYVFDIMQGIEQGYLAPIEAHTIRVDEIDLSAVTETAGDLQAGQLDDAMLKGIEGIVQKTLELAPGRTGIWFFPGVKSAELACDRINALQPGSCAFVCGETPPEERDEIMKGFRNGTYKHLSNCAVATEGFDAPSADLIVVGRPTKSRALYAQMVGRGLRVLPGLVDGINERGSAARRRLLVAGSRKPNCMVLDFAGNAGKHVLVSPEDLLGGRYTDAEVKLAKKKAKEGLDGDVIANLEAARRELKAMMAKLKSKVTATVEAYNPFVIADIVEPAPGGAPATTEQLRQLLVEFRLKENQVSGLNKDGAAKLIGNMTARRSLGLATFPQLAVLRRYGVTETNIGHTRATQLISYMQSTGWNPDAAILAQMLRRP